MSIDPERISPREPVDLYVGHPEETADLAQFLCSPEASYLNGSMIRA